MRNKLKKGFTLVELVIVIAVIAILAAVLIPTFSTVISNANKSAASQEADAAKTTMIAELGGENIAALDGAIFVKGNYSFIYKDGKLEDAPVIASTVTTTYTKYAKTITTNTTYEKGADLGGVTVYVVVENGGSGSYTLAIAKIGEAVTETKKA